MSAFTPAGSGGVPQQIDFMGLSVPPTLQDINILFTSTEQIIILPAGVRKYEIQVFTLGKLLVGYSPGTSGTLPTEIPRGCYLTDDGIQAGGLINLYVQSPVTGVVARVRYWT